ncbi:MAG: hypothetical protein SX243_23115 [Acidobacteriota bacterium]|nr:hypothetical protein [Acidobacteriota bacterium]
MSDETPSDLEPVASTKKCRDCGESIQKDASLCHHCSAYQRPILNGLKHVGFFLAVFSLIASTLTYFWNNTEGLRYYLCGDDKIELLSLKSSDRLAVANVGDGPLIVLHLRLTSSFEGTTYSNVIEIQQQVEKGKTLVVRIGEQEPAARTPSSADSGSSNTRQIVRQLFDPQSPALAQLREAEDGKISTFPARGCLYLLAPKRDKRFEHCFDLVGVPLVVATSPRSSSQNQDADAGSLQSPTPAPPETSP